MSLLDQLDIHWYLYNNIILVLGNCGRLTSIHCISTSVLIIIMGHMDIG